MKPRISMREALRDPDLFGSVLSGSSWYGWRVLLIAAAGEELTDDERVEFKRLTGRAREPGKMDGTTSPIALPAPSISLAAKAITPLNRLPWTTGIPIYRRCPNPDRERRYAQTGIGGKACHGRSQLSQPISGSAPYTLRSTRLSNSGFSDERRQQNGPATSIPMPSLRKSSRPPPINAVSITLPPTAPPTDFGFDEHKPNNNR